MNLEIEYSPSSCIGGNYQPHIEQYTLRSLAATDLAHVSTAVYDLFVPASDTTPLSLRDISPTAVGANNIQQGQANTLFPRYEVGGMSRSERGVLPALLIFIHGGCGLALARDRASVLP